jgi:hypothetical protein
VKKTGKLLAKQLKQTDASFVIPAIKNMEVGRY